MTRLPKTTLPVFTLSALLLITLVPAAARAGVTIVVQRGEGQTSTMSVEGGRARFESTGNDKRAAGMIFDGAGKKFTIIDAKDHTYTEVTPEDLKKMNDRVAQMRAMQEARLKTLPPEQRKQMEAMMGKMPGAQMGAAATKPVEFKFEKLGEKKTINGFACDMYRMLEDGKPAEELCVSPWSAGLVKKGDFEGLRKFAEEMQETMGMAAAQQDRNFLMLKKFDAFPGFPITRVRLEADGTKREVEQVKSVKRGAIDGAIFAVPAGYTKKTGPWEQMNGPGGPRPPH